MKKLIIGVSSLVSFIIIMICVVLLLYLTGIKKVSNDDNNIEFEVLEGNNYYNISSKLYEKGLIKSELWYKVYLKLNKPSNIQTGIYNLRKNMSVKEIVETLSKDGYNPNIVRITFKEGYNFYDFVDTIVNNTNNKEEDIINLLNNDEYINGLIDSYWFLTEDIKNPQLYFPLEGYLYPNTYQFKDKNVSVEEIFNTLLNETDKHLNSYKNKITESKYSIHQILTLASIVELEGVSNAERSEIAGVFYNRLNNNMNLGSDVTTYYGVKVKLSERDLYTKELNDDNGYNTRVSSMAGKIPIGPICNPSIDSINAVLNPSNNDYYYFVSDKNKKTYFTKTLVEHDKKISELKKDGLWFDYK